MVSYDTWRDRLLRMGEQMGIGDIRMLTDVLGPRAFGDDDSQAVHPQLPSQVFCGPVRKRHFSSVRMFPNPVHKFSKVFCGSSPRLDRYLIIPHESLPEVSSDQRELQVARLP